MSIFDEDIMASEVNLPPREFLYSLEQIALMLDVPVSYLTSKLVFFLGRSMGTRRGKITAINIALPEDDPIWRVSETDFKIWMQLKRITFTEQRNARLQTKRKTKVRVDNPDDV